MPQLFFFASSFSLTTETAYINNNPFIQEDSIHSAHDVNLLLITESLLTFARNVNKGASDTRALDRTVDTRVFKYKLN